MAGPTAPGSPSSEPAEDAASVLAELERLRPDLAGATVDPLGAGIKSVVWRVTAAGSEPFALKAFRAKYRSLAATEVGFHLAAKGVVAELPALLFADEEAGLVATTICPGEPLMHAPLGTDAELGAISESVGRALAKIHSVSMPGYGALPLGTSREIAGNREHMVDRWRAVWREFVGHGGNAYLAGEVRRYLEEREELWDTASGPRLCHGDARPGNVLVQRGADRRFAMTALIDYELAFAGDPVLDLAAAKAAVVDRPINFDALIAGYGDPGEGWRERLKMYELVVAMSDWSFFAEYVARAPQRPCERRMIAITRASRLRVWRARLGGRAGRGD